MDWTFNSGALVALFVLVVLALIGRFSRGKRRPTGTDPVNWWLHSDAVRPDNHGQDARPNDPSDNDRLERVDPDSHEPDSSGPDNVMSDSGANVGGGGDSGGGGND